MSLGVKFIRYLISHWYIKLLAIVTAFFIWLYVSIKEKVPFQIEVPIRNLPKGVEVFPKKVLVTGEIAQKFNTKEVLNCFKVSLKWKKGEKYATVEVKVPLPELFVEIDGIFPQKVEIREKETR
jgi:YbbR domain-containing protein